MGNTKIYASVLEDEALQQFYDAMALDCNVQGALMPDAHSGYTLPIGAVIKSKNTIFPAYVGYDIGCGMVAVKLNITREGLDLKAVRDAILERIKIGFMSHSKKQETTLEIKEETLILKDLFHRKGLYQMGTLGGGNHFIEIGSSEQDGQIWVIVHSGSRGFGHAVASHYMKIAYLNNQKQATKELEKQFLVKNKLFKELKPAKYEKALKRYIRKQFNSGRKNMEGHFGLDLASQDGQDYVKDLNFCLEYALENRKRMIDLILEAIRLQKPCDVEMFINRNHNHAEVKGEYVIHRKGATHAEKEMLGVIPGNMRDGSFIVKGKGNPESMCSSSHGAGRVLSRMQAKKTLEIKEFRREMRKIVNNHTDETIDESPKAYKNIFDVMEEQSELVEVIDRCVPFLNIKG